MPTLADLLRELRRLGVDPDEVDLPFSWFRELQNSAEELANAEEVDDYNDF